MAAAIVMAQLAIENERHRLEAAMRMRAKRQAVIVRRISLRAVMVQKQKRIDLRYARTRQRPSRDEIADIVANGFVLGAVLRVGMAWR